MDALLAHRAATRAAARFVRVPPTVREELAQEATLRTLTARGVRSSGPFAARVAARLAIDWLRRREEVPLAEHAGDLGIESRVELLMDVSRVAGIVARAPHRHRETLQLLFLDDLSIDEALARAPSVGVEERARERDRLYKRRRRALEWVRAEVTRTLAA